MRMMLGNDVKIQVVDGVLMAYGLKKPESVYVQPDGSYYINDGTNRLYLNTEQIMACKELRGVGHGIKAV